MQLWFDAVESIGIDQGYFFDIDFHAIILYGKDARVEKHCLSKHNCK
jgi:hypothetical protein